MFYFPMNYTNEIKMYFHSYFNVTCIDRYNYEYKSNSLF